MNLNFICLIFPHSSPVHFWVPSTYFTCNSVPWPDKFWNRYHRWCGPGWFSRYSDSLRAGRSGDRIPVEARFSAPVQTGPGAHPASYTMGVGSFPGAKRPGRGVNHPPPSSTEIKETVGLYPYSPSVSSWRVLGWNLPLPLPLLSPLRGEERGTYMRNPGRV